MRPNVSARVAVLIVPVLMLIVALGQGYRVSEGSTSPWVGGGFGMFATVDGHHRVITFNDERGEAVTPPLDDRFMRALANDPSLPRLEATLGGVPGADEVVVTAPVFDPDSNRLRWTTVARVSRP